MKHKVWHKYAIVYLVAAALILIATNLIARPFYQSDNMKRHKARIYKECVVISDEYISEYKLPGFTDESRADDARRGHLGCGSRRTHDCRNGRESADDADQPE